MSHILFLSCKRTIIGFVMINICIALHSVTFLIVIKLKYLLSYQGKSVYIVLAVYITHQGEVGWTSEYILQCPVSHDVRSTVRLYGVPSHVYGVYHRKNNFSTFL